MVFASPIFLWYFMPLVLAAYWLLPRTARNTLLVVSSLIFYAWGAKGAVLLLVACIVVNYAAGIAIDSDRLATAERRRRQVLVLAVVFDLGVLAIWKYGGFASQQVDQLSRLFGGHGTAVLHIGLPIGISFFTFHHLSYVVDVYRRSRPAQRSPVQFITYIAMFPQLIAGPIVRYHEISDQLPEVRQNRLDDFTEGFPRFALGLAKKVVIADSVAPIANAVFDSKAPLTTASAWLGVLAYTVQIYFDFSGYSDMAIGLGRMFGFRLPENFARPYSAVSITDFWRRWHMSLSRWFRDYLYIPLGGNRGGAARTYRNLVIVFALVGFWHGAAWTFVVWGLYHGALLVAERVTGVARLPDDTAVVPRRAVTFLLAVVGWVPFRAGGMDQTLHILHAMVVPTTGPLPDAVAAAATHQSVLVLGLALTVVLLPRSFVLGRVVEFGRGRPAAVARLAVMAVAAPYAAMVLAAGTFTPFLYFQF